jgi:hypothetical protein
MPKRIRKIWSVKNELLFKSREAMLATIFQVFIKGKFAKGPASP